MAFFINLFVFFLNIEFTEEIKRNNCINIYNNRKQHHSKYQLFSIVCYRLQNCSQCFKTHSNIQQMCGKEEVVEVSKNRECKIPQWIQKWVVCYSDTCFPNLVSPVYAQNAENMNNFNVFLFHKSIKFVWKYVASNKLLICYSLEAAIILESYLIQAVPFFKHTVRFSKTVKDTRLVKWNLTLRMSRLNTTWKNILQRLIRFCFISYKSIFAHFFTRDSLIYGSTTGANIKWTKENYNIICLVGHAIL